MSQLIDIGIIEEIIELVGVAIEIFGVIVIVVGIGLATFRYLTRHYHKSGQKPYFRYKFDIGLSLLLGLEILVAADIIKTIAFELSFQSVGILGILVIIRTLLSWFLVLEIEGRWPWQPEPNVVLEIEEEASD